MAYVRKLPSGKWSAVVRHPSGKRLSFSDKMKRVVVEWAAETERAFRAGASEGHGDRKLTVATWCDRWLAARNVEPTTAAKDSSRLRTHVLPQWGSWPLSAIGRLDVQAWVKDMTHAGVGATTVVGSYNLFSAMLADAVLEGHLPGSPCREIDLPKVVRPAPRWLTRHDYDRLQLALADVDHGHVWQAYVALACFAGLRPGELGGLDVGHVDFDRGLVRVQQVQTRAGLRAYPKSSSSARWVPFPPEVGDLLWRLCADRSSGPVFTSPAGARVSETNFRNRVWASALSAAGVAYQSPYVMRHTAASWLAQAGVSSDEIARLLGHSSTRIVATYAHHRPDRHDAVRAAWGLTHQRPTPETTKAPAPHVSAGQGLVGDTGFEPVTSTVSR